MQKPLLESHKKIFNPTDSAFSFFNFKHNQFFTFQIFFSTFLFSLTILLFSTDISGQIKIKEKVELHKTKDIESFIWPYNGCEYNWYDSTEIHLKFVPPHISSGGTAIFTIWFYSGENEWQYFEDGQDIVLKTITMEPDYGEITRIGDAKYRISISDTLTSDSISITVNYENFSHGCASKNLEKYLGKQIQITDCPDCFPYKAPYLSRKYGRSELIIKPDSFVVTIDPPEVYPGDTVQIKIQKRNADGTLSEFPPTQKYEIAKLEGCMLGNILANNDSGSYFYDVSQPIYFAAADTLVGDTTGTVLLQVGLVDNNKEIPLNQPKVIESNDCFIGSFQSASNKKKSLNVYDPIIIRWDPGTYDITPEPKMPTLLTIWIQPREFVSLYQIVWSLEVKWTSTEQTPDKVFSYTFLNTKTVSTPDGTDLPIPEGDETIVGGDDITLTGIYYDIKYPYGYPFTK